MIPVRLGLLPYVTQNILRAKVRSGLTVVGVVICMTLFGFVRSMESGMAELQTQLRDSDVLVVFERNTVCPFQARLPQRYGQDIQHLSGVAQVMPVKIYLNACRTNLDLITLYGVPATQVRQFFPMLVVDPAALTEFESGKTVALVGTQIAARRRLQPGDLITLGDVNAKVAGVFTGGNGMLDNVVFLDLEYLLRSLPGRRLGEVTQFLVRLKPGIPSVDAVAREIDERFLREASPTKTRPLGEFVARTLSEVSEIIQFAQWLGYVAVAVMALVLANTVFMSAQARRAEFAVLQVIGVTPPGLAACIMAESVALALIGAGVGLSVTVGVLAAVPLGIGVEGIQVDFLPHASVVIEGAILALGIGMAAALGPAVQAAITPLARSLRAE